ncbi:zinc finger RNA-binding protein-like [Thalassophryne amazonica]|uniref:zinc finger RNA-binding protein-like n=1 Tax=Thalassophryne amazonica TaxID=390379 RepID=UPI0014719973|nr:zinc finger RNA-binding protein-like [Thalassophryne amazonica]
MAAVRKRHERHREAYEELVYWDGLVKKGHKLLPEDFNRYEALRYWYDCLRYQDELKQYKDCLSVIKETVKKKTNEKNTSEKPTDEKDTSEKVADEKDASEKVSAQRTPLQGYDNPVMAKHSEIYPTADELTAIHAIVSDVEWALKAISEQMNASKDCEENAEEKSAGSEDRLIRGVVRVGALGNGLLLKGDMNLDMVLLCSVKPTVTLLQEVAENLIAQLEVQIITSNDFFF